MFARIFKRAKKPQTDASSPETPTQEAQVAKPAPQPDQALIEALSESRRRFKDIVEVSGDFAWETDAGGVFVYVSPGKSLGYQPDEMVGTPASRFLSKAAVDGAVTPFTAREAIRETD
ncbi:MAG: PAS domain S-box protein, partial [Alphaproteobacteria bacterium]